LVDILVGASGDLLAAHRIDLEEAALDDPQGQEGVALLAQDPTKALDVALVELPVTRWGALGVDQALAFQEADFGDGDIRELLVEQGEHFPDRKVRTIGHG
jgi:hypothetical protein